MHNPKRNVDSKAWAMTMEPMNPNRVAIAKTMYKPRILAFSSPVSPSLELIGMESSDKATKAAKLSVQELRYKQMLRLECKTEVEIGDSEKRSRHAICPSPVLTPLNKELRKEILVLKQKRV